MSDSPINALIAEYEAWNKSQGLNLGSADEHLFDDTLTDAQRLWLRVFCSRWEAACEQERAWSDAEAEAFKPA